MLAEMENLQGTRRRLDDINYNSKLRFHWSFATVEPKHAAINKEKSRASLDFLIDQIHAVSSVLEKLTHEPVRQEAFLKEVYGILSICRSWHQSCKQEAANLSHELGKKEVLGLKEKLSDLDELLDDVEMVFFILPLDPDFAEVNRELARLK